MASGVLSTAQQVGNALGVALIGVVFSHAFDPAAGDRAGAAAHVAPWRPRPGRVSLRDQAGGEAAGRDGAPAVDVDADQRLVLAPHGVPVLVPVGVLAGDAPVVLDQGFE